MKKAMLRMLSLTLCEEVKKKKLLLKENLLL